MATPLLRDNIGSVFSVTAGNSVTSGNYSVSGDKLAIDNTTNLALFGDFELVLGSAFGAAPTAGQLQLVAVDYDLGGTNAGPTPSGTAPLPRFCGNFSPIPVTGNTSTSWKMRLNSVPLAAKTDYYVYNNGTGQTLATSWVLKAQCWSPGT